MQPIQCVLKDGRLETRRNARRVAQAFCAGRFIGIDRLQTGEARSPWPNQVTAVAQWERLVDARASEAARYETKIRDSERRRIVLKLAVTMLPGNKELYERVCAIIYDK